MSPKRVALLIETSTSWGSQIIAGISDYVRRHERWVLYVDHRGVYEQQTSPSWWEGDGIIARVTTPLLTQHVRQTRTPCVNVSQIRVPGADIQQVTTNERRVGELAAETLISAGFHNFGYFGPPRRDFYADNIYAAFSGAMKAAGIEARVYDPDTTLRSDTTPHLNLGHVAEWVAALPKPAGVLAWSTLGAHRVAEACCWASINVPERVSVLAGDHDHLIAEISTPRLTCIDHAPRRVGYLAAAELSRLMQNNRVNPPVLVEPQGLVPRESVLCSAVEDELVAQALSLIHSDASRRLTVGELLKHVPASRRSLELRFRKAVGRGPAAEIRRTRLGVACSLLAETSLPVKEIARRSGFCTTEQLQRILKADTSLTPTRYREFHRRRPNHGTAPPLVSDLRAQIPRAAAQM